MQGFPEAYVAAFIAAFLLGSIPFGLIISKVFYKTDLRAHGSGNIGTTNAIRTMGKAGGFAVFVLDFGKGILSGFVCLWIGQAFAYIHGQNAVAEELFSLLRPFGLTPLGDASLFSVAYVEILLGIALCGCVLGHIFSPWLKFKGGKGIAVAVGCVFVSYGIFGAVFELAIFIVLVVTTRYVSVGSIVAGAACPFFGLYFFWGNPLAIFFCAITGVVVVWAHRANFKRLRAGTENRIGKKKEIQ